MGYDNPRYNGATNVGLTDLGRSQMKAAAEDLAGREMHAVYSSDLKRARYGGELLAELTNLPLRVEPAFREIDFGEWEGLSFEDVEARYPGEMKRRFSDMANHRIPGAETITDVWNRVRGGLAQLRARHNKEHIALFAHSGVNRAILLQALGCGPEMIWRMDQDFGCLNVIDYFQDGLSMIRRVNGRNRATIEAGQGDGLSLGSLGKWLQDD